MCCKRGTNRVWSLVWQCRRIEAWSDTKFSADQLPADVATWTRDRLARVSAPSDPAFCVFVDSVADALLGRGPAGSKVNLLAFLETLAVSSDAAGLLINSALTPALVQLFGYSSGGAVLRARCATVLGILIRYATVIDTATIVPGAVAARLPPRTCCSPLSDSPQFMCIVRLVAGCQHPMRQHHWPRPHCRTCDPIRSMYRAWQCILITGADV